MESHEAVEKDLEQTHQLRCPICKNVLIYHIQWERRRRSYWSCKFCEKTYQDHEVMKGVMICAWCGKTFGSSNIEDGSNSHGMCGDCASDKAKSGPDEYEQARG